MRIERTKDLELINRILEGLTSFDTAPDYFHFMVVYDDMPIGMYVLVPHNQIAVHIHTHFLPTGYGFKAASSQKLILEYVFKTIGWKKLLTDVPVFNKLAERFARKAGMVKEGRLKETYQYGDELYDVEIFGMTEKEYKCQ